MNPQFEDVKLAVAGVGRGTPSSFRPSRNPYGRDLLPSTILSAVMKVVCLDTTL